MNSAQHPEDRRVGGVTVPRNLNFGTADPLESRSHYPGPLDRWLMRSRVRVEMDG